MSLNLLPVICVYVVNFTVLTWFQDLTRYSMQYAVGHYNKMVYKGDGLVQRIVGLILSICFACGLMSHLFML